MFVPASSCSSLITTPPQHLSTTPPQHQHHNSTNTNTTLLFPSAQWRFCTVSSCSLFYRFYPAVDPLKLCTTCGRSYFLLQKYFFTFKLHKNLKSCKKQHCLLYISHISQQPRNASVIPFPCIEKMSKMLLVKCMHCLSYNGLSAWDEVIFLIKMISVQISKPKCFPSKLSGALSKHRTPTKVMFTFQLWSFLMSENKGENLAQWICAKLLQKRKENVFCVERRHFVSVA